MDAKIDLKKNVKEGLKGKTISVIYVNKDDKYSRKRFVYVSKGYDFLENISTIRTFVQKKNNIDWVTLEVLFKLMGYKVFSRLMFSDTPKSFTHTRWRRFKNKGYINLVMDHHDAEQRLYSLNTKGRNIVISFYEYLSGEKKIPEDGSRNPMENTNKRVAYDRKKMELIKKLNKLEVPEHKRYLYE